MSQENVEIVRRIAEAYSRRDWDSALADFDPEVKWMEMPSLGPDAATYTGLEQLREAVESWIGMWGEYDIEVCRYVDAGDAVVALIRERGRGGTSGATVEREIGELFTVQKGRVVRVRLYGSWSEALKAAG